jgi:hypothetical protein
MVKENWRKEIKDPKRKRDACWWKEGEGVRNFFTVSGFATPPIDIGVDDPLVALTTVLTQREHDDRSCE